MKNHLMLVIFIACSWSSFSQPYGTIDYADGSIMNSGTKTQINTNGFLMAGVKNFGIYGDGFHIAKTDVGGLFTGSATEFQWNYGVWVPSGTCNSSMTYISNIHGVCAIETNPSGGDWYAVAGAWDNGVFFTTLDDSTGIANPGNWHYYPFPYTNLVLAPAPKIIESQASPNNYYICGLFDTSMYVIKVNQVGTVQWSHFYNCGMAMKPHAMVESPYNSDLVVVGDVIPPQSYSRATDGFFLRLNASNGSVNAFTSIGDGPTAGLACNEFFSVAPALSTYGSQGFVIGGFSDAAFTTALDYGHGWMVKVDQNGHLIWDMLLTSSFDPNGGFSAQAVTERWNPNTNDFEYYGFCSTINGANGYLVYKLDNTGTPYHISHSTIMDEFYYPAANAIFPIDMTFNAISPDQGLHLYSDNNGNHFFAKTYFNGIQGCTEMVGPILSYDIVHNFVTPPVNVFGSLSACSNGGLDRTVLPVTYNPNIVCSNNSVANGSNNREVWIKENSQADELGLFPNPTSGKFSLNTKNACAVSIYNSLGELVFSGQVKGGITQLDVGDQPKGVYLVSVEQNGQRQKFQLIKN